MLSACSKYSINKDKLYMQLSRDDPYNMRYQGHYKVGKKYRIKNKTYYPKEVTRYKKTGIASWYGKRYGFHGNKTANGDIYNKNLLTAAHTTLPLPSLVEVTNLENNRSVVLLVNDRGPYAHNREIDLSERAAIILRIKNKGTAKVRLKYLHKESLEFLKILGLEKRHGSKAKRNLANTKCSVNCHIKLFNLSYYKKYKK